MRDRAGRDNLGSQDPGRFHSEFSIAHYDSTEYKVGRSVVLM